jgi:4-hydroxyphenylpyruvate dioxygenase
MAIQEANPEPSNPLGMDGIEFIEYATSQPQALGAVLQMMGFVAVARHRSREVVLYRQGGMNLIVNAHPDALPGLAAPAATPVLSAIALRVRDAGRAWRQSVELGAWEMPTRAAAMELNIPGIRGVGDSLIYFVDRIRDFSIYDVDFVPLPDVPAKPPALGRMHYFGVVQTVQQDRSGDWVDFYRHLFGFSVLPGGQFFGILPKGTLLESPCHKFYLQLIEPPPGAEDIDWEERLLRIGFGTPDVPATVRALRQRGVVFVDRDPIQPSEKGALTQVYLGDLTLELVVSHPGGEAPSR